MKRVFKWIGIIFGAWIGLVFLFGVGMALKIVPAPAPTATATDSAPAAEPDRIPQMGEIIAANRTVFCGSTPEAFDEMMNWATRGDAQEMTRVLLRTGSSMLQKGAQAKVLDVGGFMYGRTLVRIIETDRECWVISEAVRQ